MSSLAVQLIGQSDAFHDLMDKVSDAAALDSPVLILGQHGSGKGLTASRVHFLSTRWEAQYLTLNCAAYTPEELDDELFDPSSGALARAAGGTLFLDKIDALPTRLQEKLIMAIENESEDAQDAARLVTSSAAGRADAAGFNLPLLTLLAFDIITVPSLRARREDIAPLAEHFGRKMCAKLGARRFPGFTPEASAQLETARWPGNIRELKMVVGRSVAQAFLADESLTTPINTILFNPFGAKAQAHSADDPLTHNNEIKDVPAQKPKTFAQRTLTFERRLIDEALGLTEGHQGKAAEHLGLTYHSFRGLLRKHGLKK